ncbi:MADF domain-containing protein [Caenorhabditis elegans]|uniref:MADF domain-containing protein n=1 Tax=Caenorhabditis elegans TaxID=6239 RepID=G5EGG9_CAEEL|nr:MADF domain-containing protein [Caenorhabditis elegans]CAA98280.3 MADF domain-containing protein [Caenorhabditis elegans]|eukprot:NP_505565.3 MADF domain transcription factor [Caenorhabditis elegans]
MNDLRADSPNHDPLEDDFTLALIDSVQRNPCVYNRYDPLHKVTDYKHEIWKLISIEIGYDGQPVELERKWKHMRDKYVRLRKQDKQKAPIKKTNKWYNYYHKMSFLDPYVEHRNRKRQKDYLNSNTPDFLDDDTAFLDGLSVKEMLKPESLLTSNDAGYNSPHTTSSSSSSGSNNNGRFLDSPTIDIEDDKKNLALIYDKFVANQTENEKNHRFSNKHGKDLLFSTTNTLIEKLATTSTAPSSSRKRKPIPVQILPSSPPPQEKNTKIELLEDILNEPNEDQVSLFVRSIARTLNDLDREKFAMARVEISKVLYKIEFGDNQYSEPVLM